MRWPTLDMSREAPMNATDRGLKKGCSEAVVKTRSRTSDRLTLSWLGATEKSISTHSSSIFEWSGKPDRRNVSSISWFSRSEEHSSELQSRRELVCRLLLEKK